MCFRVFAALRNHMWLPSYQLRLLLLLLVPEEIELDVDHVPDRGRCSFPSLSRL